MKCSKPKVSFAIIIDIFRSFCPLLGQAHEDAYRFSLPYMIRVQVPCHYGEKYAPLKDASFFQLRNPKLNKLLYSDILNFTF